jgi:hypothetical protein
VEVATVTTQCAILFIGPCGSDNARIASLRALGFKVEERPEIPATDELAAFHTVIVRVCKAPLTIVGARLRAKPHFARRILIALVRSEMPDRERRDATMSGFDLTLPDTCTARDLAAHTLRLLRGYPEYRCLLRAPNGRHKAA